MCEIWMKRDRRQFFSLWEGVQSHCLRLRMLLGKFVPEGGRRS